MPYTTITYTKKNHIGYITLNRPEANNAINQQLAQEIDIICGQINQDNTIYVVTITGAGDKAFSVGADLKAVISPLASGETQLKPMVWFKDIYKPVIAAINGFCFAGAMELVLATDIRVASENAVFGQTEAKWGIFPSGGATARLVRYLSWCHAMEILLTADPITANDAYRMGLVNRVVPRDDLWPAAERLADKIKAYSPMAVGCAKQAITRGLDLSLEQGLELEDRLGYLCCTV